MIRCEFILPAGPSREDTQRFEAKLAKKFGGFTLTMGAGAWRDPRTCSILYEPVRIYTVATDGTPSLRNEVVLEARRLGEFAVYFAVGTHVEVISLQREES